ncbi:MAG TPA: hypothetical protein VF158_12520 [Longimicrobiales bacterium]
MRVRERVLASAVVMLAWAAAPAAAQQPTAEKAAPTAEEPLRLEREVFVYPREPRRDPFVSLADRDDLGPRFEDLSLSGIIYAPGGGSVALLTASNGKSYRVRRGDVVGNARVLDISANRVVFAVEYFGSIQQETLERKKKEGVGG